MRSTWTLATPKITANLELLTGVKNKYETAEKDKENANHTWTVSTKVRKSFICSQKSVGIGLIQVERAYRA